MTRTIRRRLAWGLAVALVVAAVSVPPAAAERTAPDAAPAYDRAASKAAAARIDAQLERALADAGLKPNPLVDDATFARRTYLAIAGRIPTEAELGAFLRASESDKRLDLVDALLASKGYESHLFNWWADLLRARSRLPRRMSGEPYVHWVKETIARNKPYDQAVRELLTAEGPIHARGNGATGYLMRDRNMPEDNMSNTIRVFLGSRVECAQCHNHPFDKWTQHQYFEMVAFTGGIRYQDNIRRDERAMGLLRTAQQRWGRNGQRAMRRMLEPVFDGTYGNGTGAARLPKDYKYDDAKPNDWVAAHALFAPDVKLEPSLPDASRLPRRMRNPKQRERALARMQPRESHSREAFATWLTAAENERFATVIANRMWKRAFGRGLIEPVDDIKDDTKAVAPELMDALRDLMIELRFDLKEFQRALFYSRAWRRTACIPADVPGAVADLRGPALRRMTAEQAWDSLLTLVVDDLDGKLAPPLGPRAEEVYRRYEEYGKATDEQVLARTAYLVLRYTDPAAFREQQRKDRARQRSDAVRKREDARPIFQELARARRARDEAGVARALEKLRAMGIEPPGMRAGRAVRDLQRASDLPSPAPAGHLLRELGQSERDLVEAGHTDPTVPQVLALLNAFLEQRILANRDAQLTRRLADAKTAKDRVRAAFLAVLGRTPDERERALWERELARGGPQAIQDLVWTLVNAHEFLFIQ
jgi:hypothetical protein